MELFEVRRMAVELLGQHGLGHWRVVFDRAKTRIGRCLFETREISLSGPLMALQDYGQVREAILHEIAHAITGPEHGHDEAWRLTAQRIGASGERRIGLAIAAPTDWTGTCPTGHVFERHRRPSKPMVCAACANGGGSELAGIITWRYKRRPVPMTPAYRAAEAAIRARSSEAVRPGA